MFWKKPTCFHDRLGDLIIGEVELYCQQSWQGIMLGAIYVIEMVLVVNMGTKRVLIFTILWH